MVIEGGTVIYKSQTGNNKSHVDFVLEYLYLHFYMLREVIWDYKEYSKKYFLLSADSCMSVVMIDDNYAFASPSHLHCKNRLRRPWF